MLHFFRKIRRDLLANSKFYRYLKYAIGEILLVVIGILIALQVNNWNEEKKTRQQLNDFLAEIQSDLSDDILKANRIIDSYIAKDSMLRIIRLNQVVLSEDRFYERQYPLKIIYGFESFRLQSKGYEGLIQNIDNIPKKYQKLKRQLNFIYVTNRYDLESYNEKVKENAYKNIDNLKKEDWFGDFWGGRFHNKMIEYFQSDQYENETIHFFNDLGKFNFHGMLFKIAAIECYQEIARLLSDDSPLPEHISYTHPEPEILSQIAGEYISTRHEIPEENNTIEFVLEENQFYWHYKYDGINVDQEYNVPLYWHKDHIFFNDMAPAIWEFNIESKSKVIYKTRISGLVNIYEKEIGID